MPLSLTKVMYTKPTDRKGSESSFFIFQVGNLSTKLRDFEGYMTCSWQNLNLLLRSSDSYS